jgi:membrane fusion protein (multidrug efflux system)
MKRNNRVKLRAAAGLLAVVLVLGGCGDRKAGEPPPMPEVAVVTVQTKPVVTTTELAGRTSANLVAEVRPQVGGIIQKRFFTEGSDVKAGQPLFQIDPALYQAALARSEAQLSTLQLKEKRLKELLADKAVSRQDYDDTSAALKQIQADVQTAGINLKYTTITAPISGRIGKSSVTVGALVTAHQPVALATIQQMDPMYVDVSQSTTDILRLRRQIQEGELDPNANQQKKVRLFLDDGTEYPLKGNLQFRDITVDPTTGSVILRIVFPNPKGVLLPGMFVRAVIQEGLHKNAMMIPQQAVSRDPKGNPYTLTVDIAGKVQQRDIKLDRAVGDAWLVDSGLADGDRVIVEGLLKAKPGMTVKTVPFENNGKTNPSAPSANTN